MGTVESINVEVSVHDERLVLQRKAEREVVERLKKRIFLSRLRGSQRFYYDVETGTPNLMLMHVIHIVISEMPEDYDPGDVQSSKNELRKLIKNTNFRPIAKESIYCPGIDAPVINKGGLYFLNSWRKPACIPRSFS